MGLEEAIDKAIVKDGVVQVARGILEELKSQTETDDTNFYEIHSTARHHADRLMFLVKSIYDETTKMRNYITTCEDTSCEANEIIYDMWNRLDALEEAHVIDRLVSATMDFYRVMAQIEFHPGTTSEKFFGAEIALRAFDHDTRNPYMGLAGHMNLAIRRLGSYCKEDDSNLCTYLSTRGNKIVGLLTEVESIKKDVAKVASKAGVSSAYEFPLQ